jgi:predicted DsbA family dithiol-disulfide isomerase
LEKGIAAYKERHPGTDDTFSTTWYPFYLNPDAGKSVNKMEAYEAKLGKQRMAAMIPHMEKLGRAEGINFSYGGRTGNTRDSHSMIARL